MDEVAEKLEKMAEYLKQQELEQKEISVSNLPQSVLNWKAKEVAANGYATIIVTGLLDFEYSNLVIEISR